MSFVLSNLIFVLESQPDVVQSFQQTLAAKGIDLEAEPQSLVIRHPLPLQINSQRVTGTRRSSLEELLDLFF